MTFVDIPAFRSAAAVRAPKGNSAFFVPRKSGKRMIWNCFTSTINGGSSKRVCFLAALRTIHSISGEVALDEMFHNLGQNEPQS